MSNTERPSMFKTILVAYDGSPSADAAFKGPSISQKPTPPA